MKTCISKCLGCFALVISILWLCVPVPGLASTRVVAWGAGTFSATTPNYGQCMVPWDLTNAIAIAASYCHSLALRADGKVVAWRSIDANMPPATNAVAIAAGHAAQLSLVLQADGTVVAWLINASEDYGQATVPTNLTNVVAIAAGGFHTLALVGDGPPGLRAPMANPAVGAGGFSVSVPSQSGRVYALEYKNQLTDGAWTALPLAAGARGWLTLRDPAATTAQRIYRVRQW